MSRAIRSVLVVVPARDESALLRGCLDSIAAARRFAEAVLDPVPHMHVIVVADSCTDDTAAIAREFDGVNVVEVQAARVGLARATGVQLGLQHTRGERSRTWIANTDADTMVPRDWITTQLELADAGSDVVLGTVRPDFADLTEAQLEAWDARHIPGVANGHVHGANLGIRASSYLEAGGFHPMPEHEDVDLVDRLDALGAVMTPSTQCEVVTSGRGVGRTPGGYARYLQTELVDSPAPQTATKGTP